MKVLLIANIGMFVVTAFVPSLRLVLGLQPASVIGSLAVWQLVTYMFVHADVLHIVFNMLTLWMFGVELERLWGTAFFSRYYAVTGVGAGLCTLLVSLLPFGFSHHMYLAVTIGASGAIYALLLAYALYFPNRQILFIIFPLPARVFVMILGGIALLLSISNPEGGVAHIAHLGGLVDRLPLSSWRQPAYPPAGRAPIPLQQMADRSHPPAFRRVLGRPARRQRSAHSLTGQPRGGSLQGCR